MSVSVILLPIAFTMTAGVVAAHKTKHAKEDLAAGSVAQQTVHTSTETADATVLQVQTRMRDTGLLVRALEELGVAVQEAAEDAVVAEVDRIRLTMSRDNSGVWVAHAEAASTVNAGHYEEHTVTEAEAAELLRQLDAAYGKLVQKAVVERIHAQAENIGMRVSSQTIDAEQNIRIVLDTVNVEA